MKDSKEKEHRISNLKDMIDNIKDGPNSSSYAEVEEDSELIDYLNEDKVDYDELGINDEFIYRPDEEKSYAVDLEDNGINEEFLIKTPKEKDIEDSNETESDEEDIMGDVSENLDIFINAKIGRTPVLAIISTVLGIILVLVETICLKMGFLIA